VPELTVPIITRVSSSERETPRVPSFGIPNKRKSFKVPSLNSAAPAPVTAAALVTSPPDADKSCFTVPAIGDMMSPVPGLFASGAQLLSSNALPLPGGAPAAKLIVPEPPPGAATAYAGGVPRAVDLRTLSGPERAAAKAEAAAIAETVVHPKGRPQKGKVWNYITARCVPPPTLHPLGPFALFITCPCSRAFAGPFLVRWLWARCLEQHLLPALYPLVSPRSPQLTRVCSRILARHPCMARSLCLSLFRLSRLNIAALRRWERPKSGKAVARPKGRAPRFMVRLHTARAMRLCCYSLLSVKG